MNAAHIGVTANAGVVTLTGRVDNFAHKISAEKAASRVKGVKAVAEEIEVKLPWEIKRGDEDIAAAALERLRWNSTVPNDVVHVMASKGWVTLTGTVAWHFEKDEIEHALHRSWYSDPNTINVTAQGGKITLTGKVSTWDARRLAGSTAWAAPGAISVANDIAVNY